MLIGSINGQESSQALLVGLGRVGVGTGLSDAQLAGAADVASKLVSWFVSGVTWSADKCKQLQSMLASVPGGWKTIETALKAIPGTSFTPSGTTVAYWIAETNRQTCARLGVDIMQAPSTQTPAPTNTTDFSKLLSVVKASVAPIVQTMATQPTTPSATQYPVGSIQWRSSKDAMWHVAIPRATAGLGAIGAAAPYVETATSATAVPGVTVVDETTGQKQTGTLPLYKRWQFWAAVGGGAVALTTIIVLISRGSERHARDQAFARGDFGALGFDDDDDHDDDHDEEY